MISYVKFVNIPVSDQDRALEFYTEKLGFRLVTDQRHDDKQRWIELRIGGSDTRVVLFNPDGKAPGGFFPGALACDDVPKTYEELKAKGVEFMGPATKTHWGAFAMMKDPDGNQILLSSR